MSCGSAFSCGMRRFDKYKFTQNDKPANKTLHDENDKKLRELMQLRDQQDNGLFQPIHMPTNSVLTHAVPIKTPIPVLHHDFHPIMDHGSVLYYSTSDTKEKQD